MKLAIRGSVLLMAVAVALTLSAPAFAETQVQADKAPTMSEEEQRAVSATPADRDGPWWGGNHPPGGWNGGGGGGAGGGGNAVVPEPGTMALLGMGLAALGVARRRKKNDS